MTVPDPKPVLDLIEAFRHSKTMFTAEALGIFDRLHERPATAAELAAELKLHAGALERLLDGCAALGLLAKENGVYRNQPVAENYLYSGSSQTLSGYVRYSDEALPHVEQSGRCHARGHAPLETDLRYRWRHLRRFLSHRRSDAQFSAGHAWLRHADVARRGGGIRSCTLSRLVDLGGGTGHLAIAACQRYPELRSVVFDLPAVTVLARENIAHSGLQDRVSTQDGDFFAGQLPEADLYAVGRILHDWSDEKAAVLLSAVFHRLPSGGALLIAEKHLNEDGVGPLAVNMQSLNMLVVTEGRERTLGQFAQMLRAAGFSEVEGKRTGVALDAILAVKA